MPFYIFGRAKCVLGYSSVIRTLDVFRDKRNSIVSDITNSSCAMHISLIPNIFRRYRAIFQYLIYYVNGTRATYFKNLLNIF